jgi:Lrp/AsnC family transcriptional regulator, leucine-responsive regulatory protein
MDGRPGATLSPWTFEGLEAPMPQERSGTAFVTADRVALDEIDRRLLSELAEDGRLSTAELARRVTLSAPAVAERVRRLERDGVITGYRAELDPRALGYAIAAIVRVRPTPRQLHRIVELARETPEVVECYRITGDDCFLMKLHLHSMDDLEPVLDRFVLFGQTTTSIIQSTPVPRRTLPIGAP